MSDYEYDNESEGMRDALEKARAAPPNELEDRLAALTKIWEDDGAATKAGPVRMRETPPEETPSKATGDEKVMEMPGLDLTPGGADAPPSLSKAFETAGVKPPDDSEPAKAEPPKEPWARMQYDLQQNATRAPSPDPLAAKMKSVGWEPSPGSKPPDWASLQQALQDAEHRAGTTRAVQQSFEAVAPRFHADHNAGSEDIAAAKAPLEMAQDRQKFEAGQQAAQSAQIAAHEKLLAEQKEQARTDPTSTESARARAALKPVFDMAGSTPDGFDKWTAADVEAHSKLLTPIAGQLTQERIAKGREDASAAEKKAAADAKKAEADKNSAAEAKSLEDERSLLLADPRAKKLGLKPEMVDGLDRKGLDEFRKQLDSIKQDKPGGGGAPAKPVKSLEDIPEPGMRALVHSMLSGFPVSDGIDRKTKTHATELAVQINPNYDPTKAESYRKVTEKQATSDDKMAIDVGLEHLKTARDAIPKNADVKWLNQAKQAIAAGSGSAEFTPYVTASKIASHELARVYNIGDQAGKEMMEHMVDSAQGPEQLSSVFDTLVKMVGGKQKGFVNQAAPFQPKPFEQPSSHMPPPSPLGEPGQGPPAKGSVTVFDTKTRRSVSKTPEEADAIVKRGGARFKIIGEPTQ